MSSRAELVLRVERAGESVLESKRRLEDAQKTGDARKIQRMKVSVGYAASELARAAHRLAAYDSESSVMAFA